MSFKKSSYSFSDISINSRIQKIDSFLKEIDKIVDFNRLRPILNKNGIGTKNVCGVKAYDNVVMFKVLLLQKYYDLSDKKVEESLLTNILFMRFVGLSLEDDIPDDTTICRFRNSLINHNLYDKLFENINTQLQSKGLVASEGKSVLIDASLIKSDNVRIKEKSKNQANSDREKIIDKNRTIELQIHQELKKDKPSIKKISKLLKQKEHNSKTLKNIDIDKAQDIDSKDIKTSSDIVDNGKDSYDHNNKIDKEIRTGFHASKKAYVSGYKVHIAVDENSGVILKPLTTFANTPDIDTINTMIDSIKNIDSLYADKAYKSKEVDNLLAQQNIKNNICLKEKQNLNKEQIAKQRTQEKPKHQIRAKVEHRFAHIKTHLKYHTTRFIGLVRNNLNFTLVCLASNLKLLAHQQMKLQKEIIS